MRQLEGTGCPVLQVETRLDLESSYTPSRSAQDLAAMLDSVA